MKATWNNKYGTDNPMKSKVIQEKSNKTCLKKYGVEYSVQNPDILQKIKAITREDVIYAAKGVKLHTIYKLLPKEGPIC